MLNKIKSILNKKTQSESFCEENWHLDILKTDHEGALLNSKFPLEIEIIEWIDDKRSKIDRDYFDISWIIPGKGTERGGLFLAFMKKELFHEVFKGIGKEPEDLCRRRVTITLQKHDEPEDRKSHPEWGCWLEVIAGNFISWEPESEEEKAKWR